MSTYSDRHGYAPREHVNHGVHGNGRRPEPEFTVDPEELAAWTAANRRAIDEYRLVPSVVGMYSRRGGDS
jgi:hypothetical protein